MSSITGHKYHNNHNAATAWPATSRTPRNDALPRAKHWSSMGKHPLTSESLTPARGSKSVSGSWMVGSSSSLLLSAARWCGTGFSTTKPAATLWRISSDRLEHWTAVETVCTVESVYTDTWICLGGGGGMHGFLLVFSLMVDEECWPLGLITLWSVLHIMWRDFVLLRITSRWCSICCFSSLIRGSISVRGCWIT